MRLFFAGAEIPSHRKVLGEVGAHNAALSFMGLRRRVKFAKPWLLADKFPEGMNVLVDSGAYTVNKDVAAYTLRELNEISAQYQAFVAENLDRAEAFTEFDALALGRDWIERQREDFYGDLSPDKFIPIWHAEWGVDYLRELADRYPRIGITTTDLSGRNLTPVLNKLATEGNSLHGVAMTHVDEMQSIKWDSVSSTSWVSPQQYGDTIIWTGRELKRYPKKYKEQARKRYRSLFEREGFDPEKILNDDSTELLRLSIWSWEKLVSDIEKRSHGLQVVTNQPPEPDEAFAEEEGEEVDTHDPEMRKSMTTTEIVKHSDTARIPEVIKTREQRVSLENALIEMQSQRVDFLRRAEENEGGYADPNLSAEMDRLWKMLKTKHDMEREGFSLKVEAKGSGGMSGQAGLLSRLFGEQASQRANEPTQVESSMEIIDAEVLGE